RLDEMLNSYPVSILTARIGEDWSIQEHVGHLSDLEELHEGRLDDYEANAQVLSAADLQNRKTYEANHNAGSPRDLLARFRTVRLAFVRRLEDMDEVQSACSAILTLSQQPMRV